MLGFDVGDAFFKIGGTRQCEHFAADFQCGVVLRLKSSHGGQNARAKHGAKRFGIGRTAHFFVMNRIDVAAAALDEESHRAGGLFDDFGGKTGVVSRVALARRVHDRMASKLIDDRERSTVRAIQPQQTNLRINRPGAHHLLIARHRVSTAHVRLRAVFEKHAAVFADAALAADTRAHFDRHEVLRRISDGLHDELLQIRAHDTVAVAGIDDDLIREITEFLAHIREEAISDASDATNRHRIDRHEHRGRLTALQNERLGKTRIIHRPSAVGDVHLRDPGEDFGVNGQREEKKDEQKLAHET